MPKTKMNVYKYGTIVGKFFFIRLWSSNSEATLCINILWMFLSEEQVTNGKGKY